jgi:predicted transcriptional regulator
VLADRASEAAILRVAALEAAGALRGQLDDMAARAVEKVKEADEAHCAVGEMRERAEKAEAQVDALNNVRAELLDGRDRLNAECARLVTEWDAAKAQVLVLTNALECKAEVEAQVAALTAERDGARLDLEKSQDQVAWRNQEMKSQAAALEESERTVATLAADGRALRAQMAELEDRLRAHVARWEDQGAALCVSRLETDRMRGELGQLAVAVRTQVERFLLHAGALPAAAAIIPLVELLSEAAVRHRQARLAGGLQEAAAKVQDQVQQEAAEGGQNGGGKWLGGPLIGENGDNVEGDDQ